MISFCITNTSHSEKYWYLILDESLLCISKIDTDSEYYSIVKQLGRKFNWFSSPNVFMFRIIQNGYTDIFIDILSFWLNKISRKRITAFQYSTQTLLYYACTCKQLNIVKYLIKELPDSINTICNGETALIRASKDGDIDIVKELLDSNANIMERTTVSNSIALHSAARNGQYKVCEVLLYRNTKEQLEALTDDSMTPLHIAASKLELETIRTLIYNGADVNFKNPKTKHTALHYTCTMNSNSSISLRMDCIDALLDAGADIKAKCKTSLGNQGVVELACVSPDIVGHLIARGAPEVSIEELNAKREKARRQLGKILIFDDNMTPLEDKVLNNPQQFASELSQSQMNSDKKVTIPKMNNTFNNQHHTWKTVRLFLSSTFIDMQSERELLIKRIIPKVKEQCAKYRIHLVDIDLRWGVTEEEVQSGNALKVCLQEAQQCDIFCGLLGERYGWVPSNIPEDIKNQYQWKDGYSITHMEIQEGVFRRFIPHTKKLDNCKAFFCIRDESAHKSIPNQYSSSFIEQDNNKLQALKLLKNEISSNNLPIINYTPRLEYSSFPSFGSLESFANNFENELLKAIFELHPNSQNNINDIEDSLLTEREFHLNFIEMRSTSFLGRNDVIDSISKSIEKALISNETIVISGEAGSGKSSLMAKVVSKSIENYSKHEAFILPHFIGGSPSSISIHNTLQRLNEEIIREFEFSDTVETEYDLLESQFETLCNRVGLEGHKKMIIFIDALNQLDASNQSHVLDWLPLKTVKNVAIIVSCLPSDCLDVLKKRKETIHIHVPILTENDRKEIIFETLGRFQKKLTNNQQTILLNKPGTSNPLYLTMVCEELRIFGDFDKLESKISSLAEDVPSLLNQVLERLEKEFGKELVESTLGLLDCSRFGLLEEELLEMNPSLSRFQWSEFFLSIKFYLRPIGGKNSEKVLDFFHRQFAKAVNKKYSSSESSKLHNILGDYFYAKIQQDKDNNDNTDVSRAYSESVYHLFNGNQMDKVESCLTSLEFIEKKCKLGYTYDLISDYLLVSSSSLTSQKVKKSIIPYMEFCMSNTHYMDKFPQTIFQMAYNQRESSPIYNSAMKLLKTRERKKNQSSNPLIRWTNKPTKESNPQEFRNLNIGSRANCARGSPNGQLLVTGDIFGKVKLFNASTAEEISILLQSSIRITSLSFSFDGKIVVATSGSKIYVFDIQTKLLIQELLIVEDNNIELLCVDLSPKLSQYNTYSYVCGTSNGEVFTGDIVCGKSFTKNLSHSHNGSVYCCCFTSDGNGILTGGGDKIAKLNINGVIREFSGHSKIIKGCAISSDNKWIVTCSQDRTLRVYYLDSNRVDVLEGHGDNIESCSITKDDKYIISGSWDKRVLLWDVQSIHDGNPIFITIGEHAHFLNDVYPFGKDAVVSSSADTTVKLFRIPSISLKDFKEENSDSNNHHTDLVSGMDYDPTRKYIATGAWDREAKILRADDATQIICWKDHIKRVNDIQLSPKTYSYAVTGSVDNSLKIWNMNTLSNTDTFTGHKGSIYAVAISHDEQFVASGSSDKTIKFWDIHTGNCIDSIVAHTSWVDALQFSSTSRLLLSASVDGDAKVWNTNDGVLLAHLRGHTAPILDVQWIHNDEYIVTCSEDWKIRIWKTGTWECINILTGHQHEVTSAVCLENIHELTSLFNCESLLATSSADQTIRFWNYLTGELLWIYCGVNAFSKMIYIDNLTFAAGDSRGGIHLLTFQMN